MDNKKIGEFIKNRRKQKNMTQKDLASKLFVTDKAVSKWERGISIPDVSILNSLASVLDVKVEDILKGSCKSDFKFKKYLNIVFILVFLFSSFLQIFYFFLRSKGYVYVSDIIFYIVNEFIILSFMFLVRNKFKNILFVLAIFLTFINLVFFFKNGFNYKNYISYNSFSSGVSVRKDKKTSNSVIYRVKYLFATKKEELSYPVFNDIKIEWLEDDICSITYNSNNELKEYIYTLGTRSERLDYYHVTGAIYGVWQTSYKNSYDVKLTADSKGITILNNDNKEFFDYNSVRQFGTLAIVLYINNNPKYVVSLNKDCMLHSTMGIVKEGGTISLTEISMSKTKRHVLHSLNDKSKLDQGIFSITNIKPYGYSFQNGILYIRYNGEDVIEVPGSFTADEVSRNYQISEYKTYFVDSENGESYLVSSNDSGKSWSRDLLCYNNASVESIQFLTVNDGYMLEFVDAAMNIGYGYIKKTNDGGKSWVVVNNGIDDQFRLGSKLYFINESTGFLTMPMNGISQKLYVTYDSGKSFSEVKVEKFKLDDSTLSFDSVYDFYNMPTIESGFLTLDVSQGSDGDYQGGNSVKYVSYDYGKSWVRK